jgi:hypothetical protein
MNRMKNARFDSERDADKNPTFENGWGRKDPGLYSLEAGPDKAHVNLLRGFHAADVLLVGIFFVATWAASAVAESSKLRER